MVSLVGWVTREWPSSVCVCACGGRVEERGQHGESEQALRLLTKNRDVNGTHGASRLYLGLPKPTGALIPRH